MEDVLGHGSSVTFTGRSGDGGLGRAGDTDCVGSPMKRRQDTGGESSVTGTSEGLAQRGSHGKTTPGDHDDAKGARSVWGVVKRAMHR